MKIWVDDVRPAPEGYVWCKSVNETKNKLKYALYWGVLEVLDLDHDAGEYFNDGGDYIEILNYLEHLYYNFSIVCKDWSILKIHIHSMNPVGVENMRTIIRKNNWKEV